MPPCLSANGRGGFVYGASHNGFTMTSPADLITVAFYQSWAGTDANTIYNTEVQNWITQASSTIADYCHYTDGNMNALDRIEDLYGSFDEDGGLALSNRPINSIASITQDPYNTPDSISILSADVYWRIGQNTIYFKKSSVYYGVWEGLIQVAYNAGFGSIPYSLQLATCLVVQTLEHLSLPDRDTVSLKVRDVEQKFNPISWSIDDPVFAQARELLNQYRMPVAI